MASSSGGGSGTSSHRNAYSSSDEWAVPLAVCPVGVSPSGRGSTIGHSQSVCGEDALRVVDVADEDTDDDGCGDVSDLESSMNSHPPSAASTENEHLWTPHFPDTSVAQEFADSAMDVIPLAASYSENSADVKTGGNPSPGFTAPTTTSTAVPLGNTAVAASFPANGSVVSSHSPTVDEREEEILPPYRCLLHDVVTTKPLGRRNSFGSPGEIETKRPPREQVRLEKLIERNRKKSLTPGPSAFDLIREDYFKLKTLFERTNLLSDDNHSDDPLSPSETGSNEICASDSSFTPDNCLGIDSTMGVPSNASSIPSNPPDGSAHRSPSLSDPNLDVPATSEPITSTSSPSPSSTSPSSSMHRECQDRNPCEQNYSNFSFVRPSSSPPHSLSPTGPSVPHHPSDATPSSVSPSSGKQIPASPFKSPHVISADSCSDHIFVSGMSETETTLPFTESTTAVVMGSTATSPSCKRSSPLSASQTLNSSTPAAVFNSSPVRHSSVTDSIDSRCGGPVGAPSKPVEHSPHPCPSPSWSPASANAQHLVSPFSFASPSAKSPFSNLSSRVSNETSETSSLPCAVNHSFVHICPPSSSPSTSSASSSTTASPKYVLLEPEYCNKCSVSRSSMISVDHALNSPCVQVDSSPVRPSMTSRIHRRTGNLSISTQPEEIVRSSVNCFPSSSIYDAASVNLDSLVGLRKSTQLLPPGIGAGGAADSHRMFDSCVVESPISPFRIIRRTVRFIDEGDSGKLRVSMGSGSSSPPSAPSSTSTSPTLSNPGSPRPFPVNTSHDPQQERLFWDLSAHFFRKQKEAVMTTQALNGTSDDGAAKPRTGMLMRHSSSVAADIQAISKRRRARSDDDSQVPASILTDA